MTRDQLIRGAWETRWIGAARVPVRAMVRRLRRELGEHADDPTYIFAEPRVGYWMPMTCPPKRYHRLC